jgi:hypothetical protein
LCDLIEDHEATVTALCCATIFTTYYFSVLAGVKEWFFFCADTAAGRQIDFETVSFVVSK